MRAFKASLVQVHKKKKKSPVSLSGQFEEPETSAPANSQLDSRVTSLLKGISRLSSFCCVSLALTRIPIRLQRDGEGEIITRGKRFCLYGVSAELIASIHIELESIGSRKGTPGAAIINYRINRGKERGHARARKREREKEKKGRERFKLQHRASR